MSYRRLFAELKPRTCWIELEDRKHDVVEAEGGESVIEHQTRGLRTVALAPTLGLADKDAEGGRAVSVVHAVQSGVADRPQGLPFVDCERRVVFGLQLPIVPVLLLLARHGERRESQSAHRAEGVDPTLI